MASSAQHSTSSSGKRVRTFWKKVGKPDQHPDTSSETRDDSDSRRSASVHVDPKKATSCPGDNEAGSTLSEAQKRRQQVYQAQKRHRNRKAEHIRDLEAEIARLRHLDAEVNGESQALSRQNKVMKELLASHSLDAQLDSIDLLTEALAADDFNASLNLRYDAQLEQDRWFIDLLSNSGEMH